eukprot:scaffold17434_cov114-Isochrysis_galbana.AAC.2
MHPPPRRAGTTSSLAVDFEHFMRHAKRSSVAIEDVQLAARKNEQTRKLIETEGLRLRKVRKEGADGRSAKRPKAGD